MTTDTHLAADSPPNEEDGTDKKSMRKVAAASFLGTTIEFYDLLIFGTAAALVFPTVFFTDHGLLASFATFAVAFFARPFGGILFGHFGDRVGRKKVLVLTLLIMGIATVGIGLLPGYSTGVFGLFPEGIGIWAPVLLVVMRLFQGLAVGGEWAGAVLLTSEHAPASKRGAYAMWPQMGPGFAFVLSSATFLVVNQSVGETSNAFIEYGWRIPFILSIVLVIVGLWVRISIDETPVFKADQTIRQAQDRRRLPFMEAIVKQYKEILLAAGAVASLFSMFYMGTAFLTSYGTENLGLSRGYVLTVGVIAGLILVATTAASAMWADKFGRRRVLRWSCTLAVLWSLILFPLLDTGNPAVFAISVTATMMIFGVAYGPTGSLLPELFATRYRYTGSGLGYNLGGILGGAIPPIIATQLIAGPGSIWVGVMLAILSLVSVLCTFVIQETKGTSLHR